MAEARFARAIASVLIGLMLAMPGATPAIAGPPYVTDDPEPADLHSWEIYGFATGTGSVGAFDGQSGFDINYGAAKDLQASAVISLGLARDQGQPLHAGIGDTEIELKYRFLHQQAGSRVPDVSLFPKLELPTAGPRFGSGKVGLQSRYGHKRISARGRCSAAAAAAAAAISSIPALAIATSISPGWR